MKNLENSATALFCNAIREFALSIGKKNFLLFGEVAGDDETLQRYLGRNARIDGTTERFPSWTPVWISRSTSSWRRW